MHSLVIARVRNELISGLSSAATAMAEQKGQVVSVTDAGDLVTDISVAELGSIPRDERLSVHCDGHTTLGLFESPDGQPEMTLIAFENETGTVQISITGGDASGFLGIKVGTAVSVKW